MPTIYFVFDLDETVVSTINVHDQAFLYMSIDHRFPWVKHFRRKGLYADVFLPHIIFPGVLEMIQLIDRMPSAKLAFFSAGNACRNVVLVEALLTMALGEERYTQMKHTVIIRSREDMLSDHSPDQPVVSLHPHYGTKDLRKIVPSDELDWAALIEDKERNAHPGQEKNIITVPGADHWSFELAYQFFLTATESSFETFKRVNQIFYLTGLLFTAVNKIEKGLAASLTDALHQIRQGHEKDEKNSVLSMNDALHHQLSFYLLGLEKLNEINPALRFVNHENFLDDCGVTSLAEIFEEKKVRSGLGFFALDVPEPVERPVSPPLEGPSQALVQ